MISIHVCVECQLVSNCLSFLLLKLGPMSAVHKAQSVVDVGGWWWGWGIRTLTIVSLPKVVVHK